MTAGSTAEKNGPTSRAPSSGVTYRGQLAPTVFERLSKALGPKRAGEVMNEAISRLNGISVETPQDMLDVAEILVKAGGLVQAVGRSLKVQALLRGAIER